MGVYNYGNKHPQEAVKKINDNLAKIHELYAECEAVAIEHGIDFGYEGPAGYGDGGYFTAEPRTEYGEEFHWLASSQSC